MEGIVSQNYFLYFGFQTNVRKESEGDDANGFTDMEQEKIIIKNDGTPLGIQIIAWVENDDNRWYIIDFILPNTDVCIALYTQCFPSVCGKNSTGDSGGIRTHDLLLTSADVLASRLVQTS